MATKRKEGRQWGSSPAATSDQSGGVWRRRRIASFERTRERERKRMRAGRKKEEEKDAATAAAAATVIGTSEDELFFLLLSSFICTSMPFFSRCFFSLCSSGAPPSQPPLPCRGAEEGRGESCLRCHFYPRCYLLELACLLFASHRLSVLRSEQRFLSA